MPVATFRTIADQHRERADKWAKLAEAMIDKRGGFNVDEALLMAIYEALRAIEANT